MKKKRTPKLHVTGVSHDLDNAALGDWIVQQAQGKKRIGIEGSIYLGGLVPKHAPRDKILVIWEPPEMFVHEWPLIPEVWYQGGRSIPSTSRGLRRMFETTADEITKGINRRSALRTVHELLYLRATYPDVVVYNEPEAWLRTVWYEADLQFHYLMNQHKFRLFGAFIYSDMDVGFAQFLEKNGNALSALTGDDVLLFAFDGRNDPDSDLSLASEYITYKAVMETPDRLSGMPSVADLDAWRLREDELLAAITGVNRSILLGRRCGVQASETPCLILWQSLDDRRVVTIPLGHHRDDNARVLAVKAVIDLMSRVLAEPGDALLDSIECSVASIGVGRGLVVPDSVGETLRCALGADPLPARDRLSIEDIESFERVKQVKPADIADLLSTTGYFDVSEDLVQSMLEGILNVAYHKKDWGGEIDDLYTGNVVVNGVRIPTAFMLKGNGLKRAEMRIADCGKNGDQLLRLFEAPAHLFVVQFVGQVSEAVIRDVEGKVALRRGNGKSAWFMIIDGQDTARLMRAYDLCRRQETE